MTDRPCYPSAAMTGPTHSPYRSAVEWVASDVLVDLVGRWDAEVVARAERWVRAELEILPLPVHPYAAGDLHRRRTRLEILLGAIESLSGRDDRLVEAARREWVHGASHVSYLRLLLRIGRKEHALKLALSLLEQSSGDLTDVRALVVGTLGLPSGTEAQIDALVASPTLAGWLDLVRFWPSGERDLRIRYAIVRLLAASLAPDVVFRLVASEGPVEPLVDLVERGLVDPRVIVTFAAELRRDDRATFFGLAARAAAARSESFVAARLLRESRALGRKPEALETDVAYVRAHADSALERVLRASGFGEPRPISS